MDAENKGAENFTLKSVQELNKFSFEVPSFQRGYRWGELQVQELLDDLSDFADSAEKTYLLQPLVVCEVVQEGKEVFRVLDGQQRLTTLYLLLTKLGIAHYSLSYESRPTVLETITEEHKNDSPDQFALYYAQQTIQKFDPAKLDKVKALFTEASAKKVQFLWYNPFAAHTDNEEELHGSAQSQPDEITVFDTINCNTPLTSAELIKALFVLNLKRLCGQNAPGNEEFYAQHNLLMLQWDQLEQRFADDSFWAFLFGQEKYVNRFDALFDFAAEISYNADDPLASYRHFQAEYNKGTAKFQALWKERLQRGFDKLCAWYENPVSYNYIGWLRRFGTDLKKINKAWENSVNQEDFYARLRVLIKNKLNLSEESLLNLSYKNENKNKFHQVLLLFNVELYNKANLKFPFAQYIQEDWDLEHVSSQSGDKVKKEDQAQWAQNVLQVLALETKDNQEKFIKSLQVNAEFKDVVKNALSKGTVPTVEELKKYLEPKEVWPNFFKAVTDFYAEQEKLQEGENDLITNLVLLDASTNRSYQNSPFPVKRKKILERDEKGEFVPLGTKNLFLHYYTSLQGKELPPPLRWTKDDRGAYGEELVKQLKPIFEAKEPQQTAAQQESKKEQTPDLSSKLCSFAELLDKKCIFYIPSLQRDYVYGRTAQLETEETAQKQAKFWDFLRPFLAEKSTKECRLNFIYGYHPKNETELEILDGQQRLTTLFLLYWLFGEKPQKLRNEGKACLVYRTRETATDFCNALVWQSAKSLIDQWQNEKEKKSNFSDFIMHQKWFWWGWRNDPTVKAMLSLLDHFAKSPLAPNTKADFSTIKFYFLDMGPITLNEDLYIKMNARGRALSDFDREKADLERILNEKNAPTAVLRDWQECADNKWLTYFWQKVKKEPPADEKDKVRWMIEQAERPYWKFWQNLNALYCVRKGEKDKKYPQQLLADMNALLYEKNGKPTDIFAEVFQQDLYLGGLMYALSNVGDSDFYIKICFWAGLLFTRIYKDKLHAADEPTYKPTCENFRQYMWVVKNVFLADNRSNPIDAKDFNNALAEVEDLCNQFSKQTNSFDTFLQTYSWPAGTTVSTVYGLNEEREKAKLRAKDPQTWGVILNQADTHDYFEGQVWALLEWSKDPKSQQYDYNKFKQYYEGFKEIFPKDPQSRELFYAALLATDVSYFSKGKFYTLNQDHVFSFKRALRDDKAPVIQTLLDNWKSSKWPTDFVKYATDLIISKQDTITGWQKWVMYQPSLLRHASRKKIVNGTLYKEKQENSRKQNVFLLCVYEALVKKNNVPQTGYWENPLVFTLDNKKYELSKKEDGSYALKIDDVLQPQTKADDICTVLEKDGLSLKTFK